MAGVELPLLDQTKTREFAAFEKEGPFAQKAEDLKTSQDVHGKSPDELFKEEKEGWHGFAFFLTTPYIY